MPPCATSVALPAVLSVTIDQIFFQCEIGKGVKARLSSAASPSMAPTTAKLLGTDPVETAIARHRGALAKCVSPPRTGAVPWP